MEGRKIRRRPGWTDAEHTTMSEYVDKHGVDAMDRLFEQAGRNPIYLKSTTYGRTRIPSATAAQFIADLRSERRRREEQARRQWQVKNDIRTTLIAAGVAFVAAMLAPLTERAAEALWPEDPLRHSDGNSVEPEEPL
jgi:hypothetical protein